MGFDLKEKFQNLNKKNIAIVAGILLVIVICAVGGFEYYQYNNLKAQAQQAAEENAMPMDLSGEPKKPSEYKIGIEYNQALKGNKPILALFYADWCHYCVKFMPVYQALSEKYSEDLNFAKVNVEDPKYEKVVNKIGITGFPTLFIIDPKYDNKVLLSNAILGKVETVSPELDRYIRIRKILDSKK